VFVFRKSFNRLRDKLNDYVLNKRLINSGLYSKTKDIKEIFGKRIVFAEVLLDEFFVLFDDESVFKIKTDGKIFLGKFDITKFEVNRLLYESKKITYEDFKRRNELFEDEWNKIYDDIKKDEEKKLYLELKKKFERG